MNNQSVDQIWNNCKAFIRDNIQSEKEFSTWFGSIEPIDLNNKEFTIKVPTHFVYETLEANYLDLIQSALTKEIGPNVKLMYTIDTKQNESSSLKSPKFQAKGNLDFQSQKRQMNIVHSGQPERIKILGLNNEHFSPELNLNYTFENFAEGDSNKLARSVSLEVAKNPGGTAFNPLFIHSHVGLGKTHLVNAIGIQIKKDFPQKSVIYVSSEKFTEQFIAASLHKDKNKINNFIHFYQQLDVLIIDDIQFVTGKEKTQGALYNIFNYLHQNNKQIVMTADISPKDMEDIEERLLSRFKWGLTAEIKKPDVQTRKNIIKLKTENLGLNLDESVLDLLAEKIDSNIRDIEGAVVAILAEASFNKVSINTELAMGVVNRLIREKASPEQVPFHVIEDIVVQYFEVDNKDLRTRTKRREVVEPRQLVMHFAKKYTKLSFQKIGKLMGNTNHATVIYSVRKVDEFKLHDRIYRNTYNAIDEKIKNY
ncbi:MAG: chromosomal replication initiator protein DnaA [Flavobacteriaceae bacterium]|nr:chromosomal replication initiator protein DnaA [Flavobacteriaceae bacterium]MCY4268392.1 chromosomal replication initiator protein DnaA [Flavobacteriaceae bacterium]MCY4298371.1 chromosomal replication initiator protein DnaA [Flavobacteriaceae bacterium]